MVEKNIKETLLPVPTKPLLSARISDASHQDKEVKVNVSVNNSKPGSVANADSPRGQQTSADILSTTYKEPRRLPRNEFPEFSSSLAKQ